MKHCILPVKWRDKIYNLSVCYTSEKVKELLARWPNGYIDLVNIFEHESPSSINARIFILKTTLAQAKESLNYTGDIPLLLKELAEQKPVKHRVEFLRRPTVRK